MSICHSSQVSIALLLGAFGACSAPAMQSGDRVDSGFSNPSGIIAPYDAGASAAADSSEDSDPCAGTFGVITRNIFEAAGCTGNVCHTTPGLDTPAGGLDLTREHAYRDLVDVRADLSLDPPLSRVLPGDPEHSLLYLKLAAKTSPEKLPTGGGAPMPLGLPALRADQLLLVQLWIQAGAPAAGVVAGTESLLGCTPSSAGP
jgi:hypothetical protein